VVHNDVVGRVFTHSAHQRLPMTSTCTLAVSLTIVEWAKVNLWAAVRLQKKCRTLAGAACHTCSTASYIQRGYESSRCTSKLRASDLNCLSAMQGCPRVINPVRLPPKEHRTLSLSDRARRALTGGGCTGQRRRPGRGAAHIRRQAGAPRGDGAHPGVRFSLTHRLDALPVCRRRTRHESRCCS